MLHHCATLETTTQEKEVNSTNADIDESGPQKPDGQTYPEGGWRAWSVVLGVFLCQFCTFGYTNAYGVYNDFYVREYLVQTHSAAQISWIGSVQLFLVLSSGLLSGRAFDAGYFYHLMIGGSILLVFCLFMISISQAEQYYQIFLTQGLGIGIAIGVMYIPALGIISHYFRQRRALAIGLGTSGSAVGGAIHPIMLNAWFHGPLGFRSGVKASAGLLAGLLTVSILLMCPRYPPLNEKSSPPSVLKSRRNVFGDFRVFLHDLPYVIMVIGTTLTLAGLYYPIYFIQLNSIKIGINPHLAFYTIPILNAASCVGRVIPNMLVYRFGAFPVIIPCVFVASVLIFCTLAVQDVVGTMIFALLYGFFSGAYASVLPAMVSSLADSDAEIGARMGVCFTFTGFGGLIGTPIGGALLSSAFLWWRPTLFAGTCVMGGCACFTIVWVLKRRRQVVPQIA